MRPFDRWQAYIHALLAQYSAIPEEFRLWILEWPACLAVACTWPALLIDFKTCDCERRLGVNWLGYANADGPEVSAVLYRNKTPNVKVISALLIWKNYATTEWLIFDKD